MQAIYDVLTPIFRDIFEDDTLVLSPALCAADVDEWDSLNNVRVFVAVERKYDIRFTAAEMSSLKNVGEFVAMIASKTKS